MSQGTQLGSAAPRGPQTRSAASPGANRPGFHAAKLRPALAPAGELARLVAELEDAGGWLLDSIASRLDERLGGGGVDFALIRKELDRPIQAALGAQIRGLGAGAPSDLDPDLVVDGVCAVARIGRLDLLLTAYRVLHEVLRDAWFDLVEASSLTVSTRRELLRSGSDHLFHFEAALSDLASADYHRRFDPQPAGPAQRRFRAVRELLDGDPNAAASFDFDLDRHHLGVIGWEGEADCAVRQLAETLGRPLLSVSPLDRNQSCWAWLSATKPLTEVESRLLGEFEPVAGSVAVGLECFGYSGFCDTHRQAERARSLSDADANVARYEDVAIEALVTENEGAARAFVAHELRGIDDETPVSRRIRATLAAYFAAECNAACAGAVLGIHQQTVANRLRSAEQRLGRDSIGVRRVELELALRLRDRFAI